MIFTISPFWYNVHSILFDKIHGDIERYPNTLFTYALLYKEQIF